MNIDTPEVRERLEGWFGMLAADNYKVTSKRSKKYNCIAWSMGKTNKWWEAIKGKGKYRGYHWPDGIPKDGSAKALVKLYERWGYTTCGKDTTLEVRIEKVAIYCDSNGDYTHGARQLKNGHWTSKLGDFEDISHESLEALCGDGKAYGELFCIMKRNRYEEEERPAIYPRKKARHSIAEK